MLTVAALATSAFAGGAGSAQARRAVPRMPGARPIPDGGVASVDPLVRQRLERRGSVDVLVTLDGASALANARAKAHGNSRALLRRTEPAYRKLKAGLHARVPGLEVLQDYSVLPVQFLRVSSREQLRRLGADPSVIGVGPNRKDRAFLSQSLPLIGQPAAAAAGVAGAGPAGAGLDPGVGDTRTPGAAAPPRPRPRPGPPVPAPP